MTRINLILLVALVLCGLEVITSQHRTRKLFADLTRLQDGAVALDVEFGQLQLEQRTWAMHARIERIARENLRMRTPDAKVIRVLSIDAPQKAVQP